LPELAFYSIFYAKISENKAWQISNKKLKKNFIFFPNIDCKIQSRFLVGLAFVIHRNCGNLILRSKAVYNFVINFFSRYFYPQKYI